jgi:hypothetical protein
LGTFTFERFDLLQRVVACFSPEEVDAMGGFTIEKERKREARRRAKERSEDAYLTLQAKFDRLVAEDEPEGGVMCMEILGELTGKLTNEMAASSLRYVTDMAGPVEEEE